MSFEVNPLRWSPNVKSLSGLFVIVGSIASGIGHLEEYIGDKVAQFSRSYQHVIDTLDQTKKDVAVVHNELTTVENHLGRHDEAIEEIQRSSSRAANAATSVEKALTPDAPR